MDIEQVAAGVRLLLMDVDGVMTDGKLYNVPGPDGRMAETKGFDAKDGISLQWLSWYGIKTGLISGRVSPATEERAKQEKRGGPGIIKLVKNQKGEWTATRDIVLGLNIPGY